MTDTQLTALAVIGAKARLTEINNERAELQAVIDRYEAGSNGDGPVRVATPTTDTTRRARRRSTMTNAQRLAVSRRMKAYWKARRAGDK